ncbi:hypothetical protein M2317_001315 [Microbacterium sp. ZKA21]|uniref:hypothetical protein n=1 Tax=Microbacterium sp. ZKA21 TaxID=3381694 RepID=UPI003D260AB3
MSTPIEDQLRPIEDQIRAAEAAAQQARAEAARLYAEKDEAEQAAKRARRRALNQFVKQRDAEWPSRFNRRVREAREAFEDAVAHNGDALAAWVAYKNVEAVAIAERGANVGHWLKLQRESYDEAKQQYDDIKQRFVTAQYRAEGEGRRGRVDPHVFSQYPELVRANEEYNALAERIESKDRRDAGELGEMSFAHLDIRRPLLRNSDQVREDERTFAEAFEQAAARARDAAVVEHRRDRTAAFDAYAADHDTDPLDDTEDE